LKTVASFILNFRGGEKEEDKGDIRGSGVLSINNGSVVF